MVENTYDLFKQMLGILSEIDEKLDRLGKARDTETKERLSKEIDVLESEMFDIKNLMKSIKVK